ncbi:MAG: hypothetical protein FJY97_08730, partial [candidate division Zixibacteria bacterium]|nr:hypothetical protein [candidate division Zixibacteria bacterium]
AVRFNPFAWSSTFVYDAEKGSARWGVVNDLVGVFIIDAHRALRTRWQRAIEEGNTTETLKRLAAMPVTEEEAIALGTGEWKDQAFRNRTLLAWGATLEQKYGAGASGSPATEAVVLLGSGALGLALIGYLWRIKRKQR